MRKKPGSVLGASGLLLSGGVEMTDQKIVELFFARSQDAVAAVKQKYGTRLLLLSRNILGDLLDAEECVNDTLLAAWNAIPPARPNPLFAWLCATARNISMNRLRGKLAEKRGGGQICSAFDEFADTFPDQETLEMELNRRELARQLDRFLSRLSKRDKQLFLGRYFAGKSIFELAQFLDMTQENCRVRLLRLRRKLHAFLQKEGILE